MKLFYKNKQYNIVDCNTYFSRLKGFIGVKNADYGLYFKNCRSIHTFFMKMDIDVVMCDKNYNVLYVFKNVKPNKIIYPKKDVYCTIEFPINYIDIGVNDKLKIEVD